MHEASLIRGLMRKIIELAIAEDAKQVTQVRVWLGAMSHMSADHFREHFKEASRGTIAAGAGLVVDVSDDAGDPNAQDMLLQSIEVET